MVQPQEKDDMIRIAAVDDDQIVRTGTRGWLKEAAIIKLVLMLAAERKLLTLLGN